LTGTPLLFFLITGAVAGTVGGLLGLGGGIVLIPVLRFGLGFPAPLAAGTTIVVVFFTTVGGALRHDRNGHISWVSLAPVIGAGAVVTLLFSLLFPALAARPDWLDLGIGLVLCTVALRMILESRPIPSSRISRLSVEPGPGLLPQKLVIGAAAGVFPGLLGIGTGAILVPAFRLLLRWPIKAAMGSSLACFAVNAFVSSILKGAQGYVDFWAALPAGLGAFLGADLGGRLNLKFPSRLLQLLFGAILIYVAWKFVLISFGIRI
jgi:uncharacterized membrane protein YfcA